jgi:hypothetical protein
MTNNITFITHIRYDHSDRVDNLQTILNYYSKNLKGCKFILVEDDHVHNENFDKIKWPKGTSFFLLKNEGPYWRTKALNYGISKADTPAVALLDADCVVSYDAIIQSIDAVLGNHILSYPYNGYVLDISKNLHLMFADKDYSYRKLLDKMPPIDTLKLAFRGNHFQVRCTNKEHLGMGGVIVLNKEQFIAIGGFHEKFRSWGCEDNELFNRCDILGLKKHRVEDINSVCFHLWHGNTIRHNNPYYDSNVNELNKLSPENISKNELKDYIKTWNYFK